MGNEGIDIRYYFGAFDRYKECTVECYVNVLIFKFAWTVRKCFEWMKDRLDYIVYTWILHNQQL